ncbi:MAG TPA: Uma2 family endonuclease [Chryseosolibacter sp.]
MIFPTRIKGKHVQGMSDDEFTEFCEDNSELKIERSPNREIVVQEPTHFYTGGRNSEIIYQLAKWNKEHRLGQCVDSNTGFFLSNGAMRSPDAAWISHERLNSIDKAELRKFPHLCPDFIIELKSSSDSLNDLKEKMAEWMQNGCLLGWLIDPETETVYVYQGGLQVTHNGFDKRLSGEPVLRGFEFILADLRL